MDIEEMRAARSKWFEEQARLYAILPPAVNTWPLNLPEVMLAFEAGWEAREQAAPFASTSSRKPEVMDAWDRSRCEAHQGEGGVSGCRMKFGHDGPHMPFQEAPCSTQST